MPLPTTYNVMIFQYLCDLDTNVHLPFRHLNFSRILQSPYVQYYIQLWLSHSPVLIYKVLSILFPNVLRVFFPWWFSLVITAAFFTVLLWWSPSRLHAILYTYTATQRVLFLKSDCIIVLLISLQTCPPFISFPKLLPFAPCAIEYWTTSQTCSLTLPCHHSGSFSSWNALPYLSTFCSAFYSHLPPTYTYAKLSLLYSYHVSFPLHCAHTYSSPSHDLEIWYTSIIALIILHYNYWFIYLSASLDKFHEDKDYIFSFLCLHYRHFIRH